MCSKHFFCSLPLCVFHPEINNGIKQRGLRSTSSNTHIRKSSWAAKFNHKSILLRFLKIKDSLKKHTIIKTGPGQVACLLILVVGRHIAITHPAHKQVLISMITMDS